jgi:thiamine-phosphate pyrophosphorylase
MPGGLDLFYPIVPDLAWLKRLVPLGVRTVQLRLKDAPPERVRQEIAGSLQLCRRHGCQLIVNDYWREALQLGADYVHLGQEDLAAADLAAIQAKPVRLGILKAMKWAPQGLARITDWKARIGDLPLVAIGGITPQRAPGVAAAGADSIAVITDFFTNPDPEARVREWLAWAATVR